MKKLNRNKHKWICLSVLILLVLVAITTILVMGRFNGFLPDDSGAISLISDETDKQDSEDDGDKIQESDEETETEDSRHEGASSSASDSGTQTQKNPSMEVSDDELTWGTDTNVEIFRVSYENGEQRITVNSSDGDKVIAPGTSNSYTFKLKNTGDVALDYTVELNAYFTPSNISIPVICRVNRYDGKWITPNEGEFVDASGLNGTNDAATVGAGRYVYYTLDWQWPFESGDDELDTLLGNMAVEQDITFTIEISTVAVESINPDSKDGIVPKTGDDNQIVLWVALAAVSIILIFGSLFHKKNEDEYADTEATKN